MRCGVQLVEKMKENGEKLVHQKRDKIVIELYKLKQRVDKFTDYDELDMVFQYVLDVRSMQKRLADVQDQIAWLNKEEELYKFKLTQFPEVEEITTSIDPYMRLFQVVSKWQRSEKKYVSAAFVVHFFIISLLRLLV